MPKYILLEDAVSHPFANGRYDHVHADEHFILGHESYKEWLEALPVYETGDIENLADAHIALEPCSFCGNDPEFIVASISTFCGICTLSYRLGCGKCNVYAPPLNSEFWQLSVSLSKRGDVEIDRSSIINAVKTWNRGMSR